MASKTKNHEGISIWELIERFPNEKDARKWLEAVKWTDEKRCPYCASLRVANVKNERPQPYRCKDCRKHFSVKTGTIMADSNLPLRKWVFAIYLMTTSLKGVSSMKLHRDLGMTQKTAWLLAQKIRQAFIDNGGQLSGEVEVDKTCIGGLERNKHSKKKTRKGRGAVGKAAVMGMVERGGVASRLNLWHGRTRALCKMRYGIMLNATRLFIQIAGLLACKGQTLRA